MRLSRRPIETPPLHPCNAPASPHFCARTPTRCLRGAGCRDVFKSEQAEYESEGIEWQYIEFVDNQECLDMIDKKELMGVLHLLDEECAIQKGTDDNFALKLRERHAKNKYFLAPKRDQTSFTVRHYAGDVVYACRGFREKNKDALHPDLAAVMQESNSSFVRALFPSDVPVSTPSKAARKAKNSDRMTVGSQFMAQLASLMRTINGTGVHYVRCIKPNTLNKPKVFDMIHSAHQLRCAGVLEAVRISRMAYPNRMHHLAFVRRYVLLTDPKWQQQHLNVEYDSVQGPEAAALCKKVLLQVIDDESRYQLGKSKVFFRAFLLEALEQRRTAALSLRALVLQKHLRGLFWRRRFIVMRGAAARLQTAQRRHAARATYCAQLAAALRVAAAARGRSSRRYARSLRAALRVQAAARGVVARRRTVLLRRNVRATRIQSEVRRRALSARFHAMRKAALRLQSYQRMVCQRKQYRRDLADKKEEAKLSTQIAKLQAQLQSEIDARKTAEEEQERLRAEKSTAPSNAAEPGAAARAEPEVTPAADALAADGAAGDTSISGRLAGAAAKYLLSSYASAPAASSSVEETSAMLSLVTKDREKLSQKLASETEARKRLETEKRELERKIRLGSATSQLETRKTRDVAEALARKKDEIAEMRQMLQHQTLEIASLQSNKAASRKRIAELEKKISQYDDSFYALEARNVRDRTKMEEMGKAKNKAEEEKSVFRLMLEQAHERALKERQELRRDAQSKIEASAARIRVKQQRIVQLEKQLKEKAQVEEEVRMYREQCSALMEQLSAAQQSAPSPRAPPQSPRGRSQPNASTQPATSPVGSTSMLARASQFVAKGVAQINDLTHSDRPDAEH